MGKKILLYLFVTLLFSVSFFSVYAQNNSARKAYISKYKDLAVSEMNKYKIPASIILSQALLESDNGNSRLALRAKNHFGIKAFWDWNGKTFKMDDDKRREKFRKYSSVKESYRDHSLFLTKRERYSFLFDYDIGDYKAWASGLRKAGYATNKDYTKHLIKIIEENNLSKLDEKYKSGIALNKDNEREEDFESISIIPVKRKVFVNNKVKYIIAGSDDTYKSIAEEYKIYKWELLKFNDLKESKEIIQGEKIYIHYKKRRSLKTPFHISLENETMYLISQKYAIKLKVLLKINNMKKEDKLDPGVKIFLRKTKNHKRKLLFF